MNEVKRDSDTSAKVEVETTACPECGAGWEVVVTQRARTKAADRREE